MTDGETNASIPKDVLPDAVTPAMAAQLLAERRAKGPAPKKRAARKPKG